MARKHRKHLHCSAEERLRVRSRQEGSCVVWTGYRLASGYGVMTYRGVKWLVHRMSWAVHRGVIPEGLHVLHRCDNPPCINPDHLWLGTPADNTLDMMEKGRDGCSPRPGERNPACKLTVVAVRDIRRRAATERYRDIAREFGVGPSQVSRIVRRESWAHVD